MPIDYIVSSLPTLAFDQAAPLSKAKFEERCGGEETIRQILEESGWRDIETQLKNAIAEARGGEAYKRPASGCSLYWKNRALACFQEKNVARREELLDRIWWDAAGELTPSASPLGKGALATYAIRLEVALKREKISKDKGNEAFDRLTAETKR